jgi:hypothetical protein
MSRRQSTGAYGEVWYASCLHIELALLLVLQRRSGFLCPPGARAASADGMWGKMGGCATL